MQQQLRPRQQRRSWRRQQKSAFEMSWKLFCIAFRISRMRTTPQTHIHTLADDTLLHFSFATVFWQYGTHNHKICCSFFLFLSLSFYPIECLSVFWEINTWPKYERCCSKTFATYDTCFSTGISIVCTRASKSARSIHHRWVHTYTRWSWQTRTRLVIETCLFLDYLSATKFFFSFGGNFFFCWCCY